MSCNSDPTWTADEAYEILRDAIVRFIEGIGQAHDLRTWMTSEFHTPPDTARDHPAKMLYATALANLAIYLQCDMEREELAASLRVAIDQAAAGRHGIPRLLVTPCGVELMGRAGSIEAMMQIGGEDRTRVLKDEGFEEI